MLRDEAFGALPPDSALISAYYETGFNVWYGRAVEDRRPDVAHIHQAFLTYPFYAEMVAEMGDDVASLTSEGAESGLLDLSAMRRWARNAEVRIEAEQLVTPEVAAHSLPVRLFLHVSASDLPRGALPADIAAQAQENARSVRQRFAEPIETQSARNLLWATFNVARQMCLAGRLSTCRRILDEALYVAPDDPDLLALASALDARLVD